ncbi:MAG: hypothetical protein IPP66_10645 [Anaerolineales bacterium]|nr:hypothetical protein [Anaerolineales bacterium]
MPKSSRSIQKIINPIYNYSAWVFSVFFIIVVLVFVTQYFQGELSKCFTPTVLAFSVLNLITPLVANYLYKTFSSLQNAVSTLTETNQKKWFSQQESFIFGVNTGSVATAIFLAICGGILNYGMVGCVWTGIAKFFYFLHVIVLFGALGVLGWAYWGILLFFYRLQNLKLNPQPFQAKKDEFEEISTLLFGIFSTGAILYIVAITATWISPLVDYLEVFMLQYLIFPLAIVIAGFFILAQHFLHEIMKQSKKTRLNKILAFTVKLYNKWEKSQLSTHRTAINDLLSWKEKIETEKDFPFNFFTIVFVLAAVFLPTIALFLPTIKTIIKLF